MTLTCCQDHILTENIWFVWSETSYSGDERRCYRCGTNKRTLKIELLSQWKLEAEFRNWMLNNTLDAIAGIELATDLLIYLAFYCAKDEHCNGCGFMMGKFPRGMRGHRGGILMLVIDPPDRLSMSVSQSVLSLIPISQTRKPTEDHLLSPDGQSRGHLFRVCL